jgi:hypothetical protein
MRQILETASYGISLAYASRNRFPFSTYGENFFLTIQNVVITLLIIFFSGSQGAQPSGLASSGRPLRLGQRGNLKGAASGLVLVVVAGMALWSNTLCPPSIRKLLVLIALNVADRQWRCSNSQLSPFPSFRKHPKSSRTSKTNPPATYPLSPSSTPYSDVSPDYLQQVKKSKIH